MRGVALNSVMHVISALDRQRNVVAKRTKDVVRPGAERHDRLARRNRPVLGREAPAGSVLAEAPRISLQEVSALAYEQIGIGLRQHTGIGRRWRTAEVNRSDDLFRDMRLEFAQLRAGEHRIVDPVLVEAARFGDLLAQARLGPQASDPSVLMHERSGRNAGLGNQRLMLIDALRH